MNSGEVLLDTNEGEKWKVGKQKAEIGNSTPHPQSFSPGEAEKEVFQSESHHVVSYHACHD